MARMNRVDPFGDLLAVDARGTFMGNRGCLHDSDGQIIKRSARVQWVTCLLSFKGRHRKIMSPGQYTELFFLDEATALAAGHRPCGTCQKARYDIFKQLWGEGNRDALGLDQVAIGDIDAILKQERLASAGESALWVGRVEDLPDGTMLMSSDGDRVTWLKWKDRYFRWTPFGYDNARDRWASDTAAVITPRSVVRALEAGYWPRVHQTANGKVQLSRVPRTTGARIVQPKPKRAATAAFEPRPAARSDSVVQSQRLYRLRKTPAGRDLWAYFAAILRVTGMDRGEVYPLKRFLKNFATHEQAGRIERAEGGYRLTSQGRDYFDDRYRPNNRQHVAEVDVKGFEVGIRQGGDGWIAVD